MTSLLLMVAAAAAGAARETVRVAASEVVEPCVRAAARSYGAGGPVIVQSGLSPSSGADLLVASGVELTRAVENGEADPGSEMDLARIPWVLSLPAGNPEGLRTLEDLVRSRVEVSVPASPAAYEARRALAAVAAGRSRTLSGSALRKAPVALVPLSLAGAGERVPVAVPPLVARAALSARPARPAAARAFLDFLASEPGQRAFSECRPEP